MWSDNLLQIFGTEHIGTIVRLGDFRKDEIRRKFGMSSYQKGDTNKLQFC